MSVFFNRFIGLFLIFISCQICYFACNFYIFFCSVFCYFRGVCVCLAVYCDLTSVPRYPFRVSRFSQIKNRHLDFLNLIFLSVFWFSEPFLPSFSFKIPKCTQISLEITFNFLFTHLDLFKDKKFFKGVFVILKNWNPSQTVWNIKSFNSNILRSSKCKMPPNAVLWVLNELFRIRIQAKVPVPCVSSSGSMRIRIRPLLFKYIGQL